ncbi:site-specific DNA-methyltransferase [Reichenbachiella carrageenanivorans]|uniref:site-specific DNA-methyltransferase (adenine-specific) n=1 Tax=Reichenbachiella carrageenanivorans TaxID=2979869 RepID=A0ABY6CZ56_9BACT|nr:site-specific DNA-methyltransferase [Reichenbachiella carrageenanivorans]UXX79148.1 site-specific DNA-methyltransferase [Reichenbachiella carrageenanivorans]
MDGASLTPEQEKLNALKQILPEAFSEGKIDWEKLKATLGEDINFANERYVLNWAGKSDAFKVLQTPTTKTLIPAKGESVNFDETENIFIEGENLEVLKVLQKSYFGKVKMIYIDPPYNTGNDSFIYPDKFSESKADYEKRVGDKDEEGYMTKDGMFKKNSKENGQYHSNWLNMMMPRLYLAKNLLRQDGVIFVSIDDNEVHNLRLLMNEIFGEENFVESIIWKKRYGGGAKEKYLVNLHEYILMFSKGKDNLDPIFVSNNQEFIDKYYTKKDEKFVERGPYRLQPLEAAKSMGERKNLVYDIPGPKGVTISPKRQWLWSKERTLKALGKNELDFNQDKNGDWTVNIKQYLRDENGKEKELKVTSVIDGIYTQHGTKEIENLFDTVDYFPYPKPSSVIRQLSEFSTDTDDIVLDFFAGSGTTAHAVMDLNKEDCGNRKYICIQLPELTEEKTEAYKAGYKTIADISKERIRRAGKKINEDLRMMIVDLELQIKKLEFELPTDETLAEIQNLKSKITNLQSQDTGFKVLKLDDSNFKQWQQIEGKDAKVLEEQMKLFIDPVSASATTENMVYELLLKSGKDLNSKIESNDGYYLINGNELALILEKVDQSIVTEVMSESPKKVIALDKLFKGNDQLKTNTVLQMKDAGIEFKTI